MPGRVHALLVGIDTYLGNVPSLRGCVNDIDRAEALLRHRADTTQGEVLVTRLTNGQATREAFINTFRTTFAVVAPGDTAVFYYSGHGSQEPAPPEHLEFEPDGLNETLVLADSRTDGGADLADKELAVLVGEVTAPGIHLFVVLDCCHAGSGLRELNEQATRVRRVPTSTTRREVGSYLAGTTRSGAADPKAMLGGMGYVLIAACRSDQTAKEVMDGATARGALSVALEGVLTATSGPITYLQLHRSVAATVSGLVAQQTPVLECPTAADADRPFLGGAATPAAPLLTASSRQGVWQLDGGVLHGIPASAPGRRATRLTLHHLTADDLSERSALATATTRAVRAAIADLDVSPTSGNRLDPARTYRAMIRDLPAAEVTVSVDDTVPGRDALLDALDTAQGLAVVEPIGTPADLQLVAIEGDLCLLRPGTARSLVARRELPTADDPLSDDELVKVRDEVVQVGRWLSLWRRRNPTSGLGQADVSMEMLDTEDRPLPLVGGGVQVSYEPTTQNWPRVRVRLSNTSTRPLYVAVLALSELYGVETLLIGGGEWLDPGRTMFVSADDGTNNLYLSVPEGEQLTTDLLKLLVSTTEFTATSLRQADLEPPALRTPTRGPTSADRGISARRPGEVPEQVDDWTTRELLVTTYRPGTPVDVPDAGQSAPLSSEAVLRGHSTLRAKARLTAGAQAAREALVPLLPAVLLDDPDSEPFSFLSTRSVGGEVDVLELDDVTGSDSVSPEDPLVLQVPQTLGPDEYVLPIMFDGEDYLPLGLGRATDQGGAEIRIVRLPPQNTVTRRSLGGSLKILFRKLVARRVGAGYDWPHLSLVRYDAAGTTTYDHDPAAVRVALASARTVLLLVHGIIGDTLGMTRAAGQSVSGLREGFDAVLALDYENLHTTIATTGADLAAALSTVGVNIGGDASGPRFTIVAHSMGGLISRCFIEREGGKAVVDRLVTCGTPHAGSPWPRVEDAATSLLGLGLNGLVPLGGPLAAVGTVFGFLARTAEHVDNALDEMRPGSPLLTELADAADPGVPYVVVRGTEPLPPNTDRGVARRVVAKLTGVVLDQLFDGQPNDLAVSVQSATAVGAQWALARIPRSLDAACSHLTYFTSNEGLAAVRSALQARHRP
ncbi:MAG: caspase family protein [Pseudonocardiaceae bacterium]